jgi:hypothetical protein
LIIFVLSCYAEQRQEMPEIAAAKQAYRAQDALGIWQMAVDWLRNKRWVDIVTKPMNGGQTRMPANSNPFPSHCGPSRSDTWNTHVRPAATASPFSEFGDADAIVAGDVALLG